MLEQFSFKPTKLVEFQYLSMTAKDKKIACQIRLFLKGTAWQNNLSTPMEKPPVPLVFQKSIQIA